MTRTRKAIPLEQQLAAALACLLPQDQRDALRAAKVPAKTVIRLFSPDHIHLHSLGGSDRWWNLDPKQRPAHADKSRQDTSIAAKVKRLAQKPKAAIPDNAKHRTWGTPLVRWPWPKRKWPKRCLGATRKPNVRDISESR